MIRTIRTKMLALIAICMAIGAVGLGWFFSRMFDEFTARSTRASIQHASSAFADVQRTSIELMSAMLASLSANPEVRAALASRDSARALVVAQPLFRDYRARFGITHWNFWEPEAPGDMAPKGLRNIVRVGTPDMHGDFVERVTLARVARERRLVTGLDLGYTGMVLRALVPVEDGSRVIGYLEFGKEIGSFLREMEAITGDEFGLLIEKRYMDEKKWATHRTAAGVRNNWKDMPELLLVQNTTEDSEIFRFDGSLNEIPENGGALGVSRRGGRVLERAAFPIRDVSNNKIGGVFIQHDVTVDFKEMRTAELRAILGVIGLMIVLAIILVTVFQVLVVRRLRKMIGVATRVVGGDFDLAIVPSANDELGEFETLFEQFRMLFVELIGQAHSSTGTDGRDSRGGR